ncbi:hypothetical protein BOX15_Mlig032241g1, partial [Macrostomum lignano]
PAQHSAFNNLFDKSIASSKLAGCELLLRTLAMALIINRLSSHACCAAACYTTEDTPASVHGFAVHLHKFPSDDQVAVRWIEILELRDVDLNFVQQRRLKVCSLHFKETDYSCPLHERRSARLRKDALPNPYTFPPRLEKESVEVEPRPDHIADNMYPPVLHREDTYAVEMPELHAMPADAQNKTGSEDRATNNRNEIRKERKKQRDRAR